MNVSYDGSLAAARRKLGCDNPIRLNLASGSDARLDHWNMDIVQKWPNSPLPCDQIWDARKNVIPFPDASVDAIVAGYLLLHVPYCHHEPLVAEMFRTLKPGGKLEVGEVDMNEAMTRWMFNPYDESARTIIWGEMGSIHGQQFADYDKHCSGHTERTLIKLLEDAGFVGVDPFKQHSAAVWYEVSVRAVKP